MEDLSKSYSTHKISCGTNCKELLAKNDSDYTCNTFEILTAC